MMDKLAEGEYGDHAHAHDGRGNLDSGTVTSDRFQITIPQISDTTPFPSFSKPMVVGCFSLMTSDRRYVEGPASLKFCHLPTTPNVKFDLNRHVLRNPSAFSDEAAEEASLQETSQLVHLLQWIHRHEERFRRRLTIKPSKVYNLCDN